MGGLGFWGRKLDSVMFMTAAAVHKRSRSGSSGSQGLVWVSGRLFSGCIELAAISTLHILI